MVIGCLVSSRMLHGNKFSRRSNLAQAQVTEPEASAMGPDLEEEHEGHAVSEQELEMRNSAY